MRSLEKKPKIIIGIGILLLGIIGLLIGTSFVLSIISLIIIPSGISLIISAI